jgi:hypothetical protein
LGQRVLDEKSDRLNKMGLVETALRLDPTFARAYAGLSFTHFQNAFQGWAKRQPAMDRAYLRPRYNGYLHLQDHGGPVVHDYLDDVARDVPASTEATQLVGFAGGGNGAFTVRTASTTLSTRRCFALPFVEKESIATRGSVPSSARHE